MQLFFVSQRGEFLRNSRSRSISSFLQKHESTRFFFIRNLGPGQPSSFLKFFPFGALKVSQQFLKFSDFSRFLRQIQRNFAHFFFPIQKVSSILEESPLNFLIFQPQRVLVSNKSVSYKKTCVVQSGNFTFLSFFFFFSLPLS